MFAEPNDGPEDSAEKITEMIRGKLDQLEEGARSIGLYQQGAQITATIEDCDDPSHDHSDDQPTAAVLFIVGEQAFTDRVAEPENYEMRQEFRGMAHGIKAVDQEAEAARQAIAEGGIDALLEDDDEDDDG